MMNFLWSRHSFAFLPGNVNLGILLSQNFFKFLTSKYVPTILFLKIIVIMIFCKVMWKVPLTADYHQMVLVFSSLSTVSMLLHVEDIRAFGNIWDFSDTRISCLI